MSTRRSSTMTHVGDLLRGAWLRIQKILVGMASPLGRRALRNGVGASLRHRDIIRSCAPATVLDVGANRGQFSLDVRAAAPGARIHAFEPYHHAAECFRSVFRNDTLTTLHEFALGSAAREMTLHVSDADDSSSLLAQTPLQEQFFPGTGSSHGNVVAVQRLDECSLGELARPVLLKLDVQGYELETLRGSEQTLDSVDYIYAEVSFFEFYEGQPLASELISWLWGHGFEWAGIGDVSHVRGETAQADLLFRKAATATS